MTVGYCDYHHKYLDADELKTKKCKKKENTGKMCGYLTLIRTKQKYRNDTNYYAAKKR